MNNLGWYIIDAAVLLMFVIPTVWFTRQARESGDRVEHGAAISFGVVAMLVAARIVQAPVL